MGLPRTASVRTAVSRACKRIQRARIFSLLAMIREARRSFHENGSSYLPSGPEGSLGRELERKARHVFVFAEDFVSLR